jgi:hypothetical protein
LRNPLQKSAACLYQRLLFLGCFASAAFSDFPRHCGFYGLGLCASVFPVGCGWPGGVPSGCGQELWRFDKVGPVRFGSSGGSCPVWTAGF